MNLRKYDHQIIRHQDLPVEERPFPSAGQTIVTVGNGDIIGGLVGTIVYVGKMEWLEDDKDHILGAFPGFYKGHSGLRDEYTKGTIKLVPELAAIMENDNCWWLDITQIKPYKSNNS